MAILPKKHLNSRFGALFFSLKTSFVYYFSSFVFILLHNIY